MNHVFRTSTNVYSSVTTLSNSSSSTSVFENEFNTTVPRKYQEVARLASQITGKAKDKKDDLFMLIGIKNILMGA